MNSKYKYEFNCNECWYKTVCKYFGNGDICNSGCERFMEMDYLMFMSRLPPNKQIPDVLIPEEVDVGSFDILLDIKNSIVDFVRQGGNLYIYSKHTGNGKTSWAIKLLLKYFDEMWSGNCFTPLGLFVHVPTFLRKVTESVKNNDPEFIELKDLLLKVNLVVWDDIGSTRLSEFDHKYLLSFIDERVINGLSNIYTGNLSERPLLDAIGARLFSRVFNNSVLIELFGCDRRGL